VLARVKIDLIEENNPSLTMFLGKISNSVISVSVTARIIDLKIKNSLNYSIYSEIFDSNIQNIENLTKNLSEYSDKYWKDCESSDFLQSNIMPVVYLNKTLFYSKINLYDFLIEFNANVIVT
jgi:cell division septal protein FtsQ